MRLLQYSQHGGSGLSSEFALTADLAEADIPPYAILSHRWLTEAEETTFEDLDCGTGEKKKGYGKLRFCGEQAKLDNLHYFWIDTCCINKKNPAELSQAIKSMFRWYRNASKCYVYLQDVSSSPQNVDESQPWDQQFRDSVWFKRCWTLQELLAPKIVEFFSCEGRQLGDKVSEEHKINEITSIPKSALRGAPLYSFTKQERISWTITREAALDEDNAYSLLGIFDIDIATIYGLPKGQAWALLNEEINKREECVSDLYLTNPLDDKVRIEDSKGGLLDESYRWILENTDFQHWRNDPDTRTLWIRGDPGKGKTMLMCGIINELQKSSLKHFSTSYFFCQANEPRNNNATAVVRGLIYVLVYQQPLLARYVQQEWNHSGKKTFEGPNAWFIVSRILANLLEDPSLRTTYLIIDALDECTDVEQLLDFIGEMSSTLTSVKWIVSSRNWSSIEERLERIKGQQRVFLSLELNDDSVSAAVSTFIGQRVLQLTEQKKYDDKTRDTVLEYLRTHADNTFLWAALVCNRLETTQRWKTLKVLENFPPRLDALYEQMWAQIQASDDASLYNQILSVVVVVYRPITLKELTTLIEDLGDVSNDMHSLRSITSDCGSFLALQDDTINFVHQSAKDFLLGKQATETSLFRREQVHFNLASRSLQIMSKTLKRDMYGLKKFDYSIKHISLPNPDFLAPVRYLCQYWIDHLCACDSKSSPSYGVISQINSTLNEFLKSKYLYWLEALSLCHSISDALISMGNLESFLLLQQMKSGSTVLDLVRDGRRFMMYHRRAIENYPLQTYVSALVFSPALSAVKENFKHEQPAWITIKPPIPNDWGACLQILEGHSSHVKSVAPLHNSNRLASASNDRTIKIWDASSGVCLRTLEGHTAELWSVAASNSLLASGSDDTTIRIWNIETGESIKTIRGHSGAVFSVAWSHNSSLLASASADRTIKVWDTRTGECQQTLRGHGDMVYSVAWSHDSCKLASASADKTIRIWKAKNGKCSRVFYGHTHRVDSVSFSNDSELLASGSADRTVKIWVADTGDCLMTLDHHHEVASVVFSPDSHRLVSASWDCTVKVWDIHSGACLQTLRGHGSWINSVVFLDESRLASGSRDHTIMIWDTNIGKCHQTMESHSGWVWETSFSHDSKYLATASDDQTARIWDVSNGRCIQKLEGHTWWVRAVAFSHDSSYLASGSWDNTVKVWDVNRGKCVNSLIGHRGAINRVVFSHDSGLLASASNDNSIKIWNVSSGRCFQTLSGHSDKVFDVAFSVDSCLLASASHDKTVKIWKIRDGECVQTLEGHSSKVSSVTFSHDSSLVASTSDDSQARIWDLSSSRCLQIIWTGRRVFDIFFDAEDHCLCTNKNDVFPIDPQPAQHDRTEVAFRGLGLSPETDWIMHDSERIVWLPPEYRSDCWVASPQTLGVAVPTGAVWLFHLNYQGDKK